MFGTNSFEGWKRGWLYGRWIGANRVMDIKTEKSLVAVEDHKIRRVYDEKSETWFFSVVDVVAALTQQPDYQTARKYWNKLKERLKKEGSQSVTSCHQLQMVDGEGFELSTICRRLKFVSSARGWSVA
jgi:nitrate/TMAO reductase-like tetraheme cytochrome c subunit